MLIRKSLCLRCYLLSLGRFNGQARRSPLHQELERLLEPL